MNKKLLKKSFVGFMVLTIFLWPLAPISASPATNKIAADDDLLLRKLQVEQLEKAGQEKDFKGERKTKTFSADESLKKSTDIKQSQKQNYVEGEVLVKFKERKINLENWSGRLKAENFAFWKGLEKKEDIRKSNISVLKIKGDESVEGMVEKLKNDSDVEYVQPNFQYYPLSEVVPWGLEKIEIPEAWEISKGEESEDDIIVAVIDSGVAYNHPDLADNMWNGNTCTGLDKNGVLIGGSCQHGYDYEDNDKIPLPTSSSHGTHIAGTIGAVKNDSGIIGVAPNVKIMALKSSLTTADNISSINFAEENGAKIINASWGSYSTSGEHYDVALYNAIDGFSGLFVVAAGNESYNHDDGIDEHKSYPDGFKIDTPIGPGLNNIIVVAAIDQNDDLADFSDYGATSVDVGAPGTNIYSTISSETSSNILDETFEGTTPPAIPGGWIKGGSPNYWGTYDFEDGLWDNVLYGDYSHIPYENNVDSTVTLPSYNLNDATVATIDFWTKCDTEYFPVDSEFFWTDYMTLELSQDGINFTPELYWNEAYIDSNYPDSDDSAIHHFQNLEISSEYLTSNFKLRFRWSTDSSNAPDLNYDGCLIDDVKITKYSYSDGSDEQYDYMNGTSMAAPYVAGLAALIWGYDSSLTYNEVKDVILTTGDPLDSLAGKTATGKRINAHSALLSLADVDITSPVITLIGSSTVNIYVGDTYIDEGATSTDDVDGDITGNIITIGLPIDTTATGTHIITYNVSDSAGNPADEVIRTVIVNEIMLESIEITNPAEKLVYIVGEVLDISGLEITGVYNNGSTQIETITMENITGFDSSAPVDDQVLTITVNGNTTTYTIDVIPVPDTASPVLTEIAPVQTPTNDNTPDYTFNSDEAGIITYSGGCASDAIDAVVGDNTITFNELADGVYGGCQITVTDASNNASAPLIVNIFTVDTIAPVVSITSPADGLITNQNPITLNWTVDGEEFSEEIILIEGENILTKEATDDANNTGSNSVTVILDTVAPTAALLNTPPNPTNQTTTDIIIGDEEITHYRYSLDGGDYSGTEVSVSEHIQLSDLADGEHTLSVIGRDEAGNWQDEADAAVYVWVVDTVAPIVAITSPADGLITNQPNITIEYTIDGTAYSDDEILEEGENTVVRSEADGAGNTGSDFITVILDTTSPTRGSGLPTGALSAGTVETTLSLTTNEDAVCRYATTTDIEYNAMTGVFDTTGSTSHSALIAGLTDGSAYAYYVKCQDKLGNVNIDDYEISFSVSNPAPAPACGDGACNGNETCSSCSSDCGSCPSSGGGGGGGGGGAPADTTAPAKPSQFIASRKAGSITLTWVNPAASDFNKVIIIRDIKSISNTIPGNTLRNYGAVVYDGNLNTYEDKAIKDDIVYYYAISAYDNNGNYSLPTILTIPTAGSVGINKPAVEEKVEVLGVEADYRTIQLQQILTDANDIWKGDVNSAIANAGVKRDLAKEADGANKYTQSLIKGITGLTAENKNAITNFIVYGTNSTQILGAGERAGVINSYKSAFGKLPATQSEWEDAIKIANGRWPTERSEQAEKRAKAEFKKVYLRDPNMNNPNDNAAVTVIAYGLRPDNRNLNSEKIAIKTFKAIYGYNPSSAVDWDIVRAIAYSGAKR